MYKRADPALYCRSEGQLRWKSNHLGARQVIICLYVLQPFAFEIIWRCAWQIHPWSAGFWKRDFELCELWMQNMNTGLIQLYNVLQQWKAAWLAYNYDYRDDDGLSWAATGPSWLVNDSNEKSRDISGENGFLEVEVGAQSGSIRFSGSPRRNGPAAPSNLSSVHKSCLTPTLQS